jgi:hypothetical protein
MPVVSWEAEPLCKYDRTLTTIIQSILENFRVWIRPLNINAVVTSNRVVSRLDPFLCDDDVGLK